MIHATTSREQSYTWRSQATTRRGSRPDAGQRTSTWTDTAPPATSPVELLRRRDGHEVLIDYADHTIYYECSQVGVCTRQNEANGTQA